MAVYGTVQGNTAPDIIISLKRNKRAIDLSDASAVDFTIKHPKTKQITNSDHTTCAVLDAEAGQIGYSGEDTDFDGAKERMEFEGEVKITYDSGRIEYIYEKLILIVRLPNEPEIES